MFNIARPSGKYKVDEVIAGLKAGFQAMTTRRSPTLYGLHYCARTVRDY